MSEKPANTFKEDELIYAGLDIGGTKLAAGLVTATGKVLLEKATTTEAHRGGQAVLAKALDLVEELIADGKRQSFGSPAGIGIASAGRIDPVGGLVVGSSDLIPGWTGLNLVEAFETHFSLPGRADNDVNALALAEQRWGAGRGYSQVLFVAAGTGLGGGLIINGHLQRGANYCAGEIGHTIIEFNGRPCECGRRGCLEQYTASSAVKRYYHQNQVKDLLSIQEISRLATGLDEAAVHAFEEAGSMLGLGLASLVCALDPEAIIIGGGLVAASPYYFKQVCAAFEANAWLAQKAIKIKKAELGSQAGIIGGGSLFV